MSGRCYCHVVVHGPFNIVVHALIKKISQILSEKCTLPKKRWAVAETTINVACMKSYWLELVPLSFTGAFFLPSSILPSFICLCIQHEKRIGKFGSVLKTAVLISDRRDVLLLLSATLRQQDISPAETQTRRDTLFLLPAECDARVFVCSHRRVCVCTLLFFSMWSRCFDLKFNLTKWKSCCFIRII